MALLTVEDSDLGECIMIGRPAPGEYAAYYGRYVELVPERDLFVSLKEQIAECADLLGGVPEAEACMLHEPYTWTIKQVVGHLIDVERVFGYRAHRFAVNDAQPIAGMDENACVAALDYDAVSLGDLVIEFKCSRRSNLYFLKRLSAEAWDRSGTADGKRMSVRAIAYVLVGHVIHHLAIIRKRVGTG